MASVLKSNIIQRFSGKIAGADSSITIGNLIGGITPTGDLPVVQALNATGLPPRGDALGTTPPLYAQEFHPRPFARNSKTRMWVDVVYRPPIFDPIGETIFELRSTTKTVTRAYANGRKIEVPYRPSLLGIGDNVPMRPQTAQLTDTVGVEVLTVDYVTFSDPVSALRPFRNAINDSGFNGAKKWCVFVSEIAIRRVRFQAGWSVRIEMLHDPETWLQTAFWRDIGGIIPNDIDVLAASTADPGAPETGVAGYHRGTLKIPRSFSSLTSLIPGSSLMPSFG